MCYGYRIILIIVVRIEKQTFGAATFSLHESDVKILLHHCAGPHKILSNNVAEFENTER